jgi:hypothetical protein
MMKALHHGGLSPILNPKMEGVNLDDDGYQPNPGGLYEVGLNQYMDMEFQRAIPDGSVVKILFDGLPFLPYRDYKIIWMERDLDEIKASTERVDQYIRSTTKQIEQPEVRRATSILPFNCYKPYNQTDIDHVLSICDARSDMHVIRVNFHDMISQPHHEFETLRLMGVPIDPEKAAAVINPKLWRIRNEHGKSGSKERPSEGVDSASEAEDTRRAS